MLVVGEAGIGKSRLVAEFTAPLAAAGTTVVVGTCDPDQSLPYRPFVEIARQLGAPLDGPCSDAEPPPAAAWRPA